MVLSRHSGDNGVSQGEHFASGRIVVECQPPFVNMRYTEAVNAHAQVEYSKGDCLSFVTHY